MLYFSLNSLFKMRGIENPHATLIKAGIYSHSTSSLLNSEIRSMRFDHLEKLCNLLNCTPNDLLTWRPDANTPLPDSHALKQLQHKPEEENLYQTLKSLPLQELKNIAGLIHNGIKNSSDK